MEELVMAVRRCVLLSCASALAPLLTRACTAFAVSSQSQGFARGSSAFRGVTHHPNGRWEARLGVPGSRHIYLGLFTDESEAARAYDRALVRLRGPSAATNFSIGDYGAEMREYDQAAQEAVTAEAVTAMPALPAAAAAESGGLSAPLWLFEGAQAAHTICCLRST
jgi:hypothetical protein